MSIEIHAAGIAFGETLIRRGRFPAPSGLPWTPGFEVAGIVRSIGEGVTRPAVGQRVAAMLPHGGGYAEVAVAPAWATVAVPEPVGFDDAVALVSNGLSAACLLEHVGTIEGRSVLVTAAAGGVGGLLVRLAQLAGTSLVVGAVGSPAKRAFVEELEADVTACYGEPGWIDAIRTATEDRGVDVVFDAVGEPLFDGCLELLAEGGTLVPYGASSGRFGHVESEQLQRMVFANQRLAGFVLVARLRQDPAALSRVLVMAAEGTLRPAIHSRHGLEDCARAHALLEARETTGKLVLEPRRSA